MERRLYGPVLTLGLPATTKINKLKVKRWKNIKGRIGIFISDKIYFTTQTVKRQKKGGGYYVMIRGLNQQKL